MQDRLRRPYLDAGYRNRGCHKWIVCVAWLDDGECAICTRRTYAHSHPSIIKKRYSDGPMLEDRVSFFRQDCLAASDSQGLALGHVSPRASTLYGISVIYLTVNLVFEPVSSAPVSRSQPSSLKELSCFLRSVDDTTIERSSKVKSSFSKSSPEFLSC
jgi:hypothetical protein